MPIGGRGHVEGSTPWLSRFRVVRVTARSVVLQIADHSSDVPDGENGQDRCHEYGEGPPLKPREPVGAEKRRGAEQRCAARHHECRPVPTWTEAIALREPERHQGRRDSEQHRGHCAHDCACDRRTWCTVR